MIIQRNASVRKGEADCLDKSDATRALNVVTIGYYSYL